MTDNEIIKALECCNTEDENGFANCDDCPYYAKGMCLTCPEIFDLINRQKAELENQSENFKVLVSDHRTLQQSFDNLKGLYEAEKAKAEKAKEKCIGFAKELQKAKAELKETTEKFNCQQHVYADLSDIIKEKNAEIEKLQSDNSSMQSTLAKMSMGVEEAKAEAIKEFAERLKKIAYKYFVYSVTVNEIDNLVKEMVGDAE